MHTPLEVIVLTTIAGAAMPIGGALAVGQHIQRRWLQQELRHGVVAFGGGILLSAVALVLVPQGIEGLPLSIVITSMCVGAISFCMLDIVLDRAKTSAAQLVAMLSDFVPEALALGAVFATGSSTGLLLALLIGLQNLPEGFNAYREVIASGRMTSKQVLWAFVALVPLGPIAGLTGLYVLAPHPSVVHTIMLFAAGGILYLTFQDIAPQAKLENRWGPPIGAVIGFLSGLVGQILIAPH